jgi:hypothetical protein
VSADGDLDRLYELPPDEFVAARNHLASELRAEKRRDEAAAVAALRRPTAAAWALNQVARREPRLIEDALSAGDALRAATDAAVAGDASKLRRATAADRAATDAVADAAVAAGGRADARQQMAATLRAAVLDDEVADALRRGVLTADHDASGFGFGAGPDLTVVRSPTRAERAAATKAAPSAVPTKAAKPAGTATTTKAERDAARLAAKEAEERARDERRRRAALAEQLTRLERKAKRLAQVADRAEEAARDARAAADAAAAELGAARDDASES